MTDVSRNYCVYILASRSRNLYVGVTGDLEQRLIEHRDGLVAGFTTRYPIFRLVEFEVFGDVTAAIAREKEIKGWRREKKIRLIERANPTWADLAERLPTVYGRGARGAEKKTGAGAKAGEAETEPKAEAKAEAKTDPSRR